MSDSSNIRAVLRNLTPPPARVAFNAVVNYARRIRGWIYVARNMQGTTRADKKIVWDAVKASPVSSLQYLTRWREPRFTSNVTVKVRELGTFHVRGNSDDVGHVMAGHHDAIFRAIRDLVRPGDTVIDAGANIGGITVRMAKTVGPSGQVIAVEMVAETAAVLRRNIALNDLNNVRCVERALASQADQQVEVAIPVEYFGMASIVLQQGADRFDRRLVQTTTLDQIIGDIPRIALMKMDLEGAEFLALEGSAQSIGRIEAVVFESYSQKQPVVDFFSANGFSITDIDGLNYLARKIPN